jgi:esterase/lipase superfamily enzyme
VFYNNPIDFLPGANQAELWQMNIILGIAEDDICRGDNERLANVMSEKNIKHWLDIHGIGSHDWPMWRVMFPHYLSTIK